MIYTAVLVACLLSEPTDCREHHMLIQGNGIPYSVAIEAQTRAAEWLSKHPELVQQGRLVIRPGRSA